MQQYFGTVIPPGDNKFAALNSAVWSGGSFIYVPPGVHVDMPLQAYFRINAENAGQFERTLIIADEGSSVHYVEGCSAPVYSTDSLHSAVVELIAKPGARIRYTTIQNWSPNVYNLVTKRARAETEATVEWIDGNLGSKLTMKYPAVVMTGPKAHGEVLSVAYAGPGQHQDAGAKMTHAAPETTSIIDSKSISKDGGRTTYRGLVRVEEGAHHVKSHVRCDALILDEDSRSDTYPYMEIEEKDARIGHEATVSKVGDDQLFYLMSRGLTEQQATAMIVNGFIEPITKTLPMEYAVELSPAHRAQHGGRGRLTPLALRPRSPSTRRARSAGPTGSSSGGSPRPSSSPAIAWPTPPRRSGATAGSTSSTSTATGRSPPSELGEPGDERAPGGGPVGGRGRRARRASIVVRNGRVVHHELDAALEAKGVRVCGLATCDDADVARARSASCSRRVARRVHGAARRVPRRRRVRPGSGRRRRRGADRRAALVARATAAASFPHTLVVARRERRGRRCSTASARPSTGPPRRRGRRAASSATTRTCGTSRCRSTARARGSSALQRAHVGRDATLRSSAVALGGDYARLRSESLLDGEGAESDLLAVYFGDGTRCSTSARSRTTTRRAPAATCCSRARSRTTRRSVYSGLVRLRPDARRSRTRTRRTATSCSPRARARSRSRTSRSRPTTCSARTRRPSARSTTTSSTTSRAVASRPTKPSASSCSASSTTCSSGCRCSALSQPLARARSSRSSSTASHADG